MARVLENCVSWRREGSLQVLRSDEGGASSEGPARRRDGVLDHRSVPSYAVRDLSETVLSLRICAGLDFFITEIPDEVFTFSESDPMHFTETRTDIYPYLLVNIGSGVSMVKVSGPKQYERIGGTSLGGGLSGVSCLCSPERGP